MSSMPIQSVPAHDARSRCLNIPGGYNIRDLGGIPLLNGGETRRGILVRGESPSLLGDDGMDALIEYGVRHVIDLRSDPEVVTEGVGPLMTHVESGLVAYYRADMTPAPGQYVHEDDEYADLAQAYLRCLTTGGRSLASALDTALKAASQEGSVVYFHCELGKDRTGTVASTVLNLLGVDRALIVDDYALTGELFGPIIARVRTRPAYLEMMKTLSDETLIPRRQTMDSFLELLDGQGGGGGWLLSQGVGLQELDRLRGQLTIG